MSSVVEFTPLADLPLHERVAAVVRAEMARYQVSQHAAAAALGMTHQAANRKVRGLTPFTINELDVLSKVIRMSPDKVLSAALEWAPWDSNPQPTD